MTHRLWRRTTWRQPFSNLRLARDKQSTDDPGTLLRAALEGLALRYRICLDSMQQMLDTRIDVIHVVGGGSMNALLCQMTADACNRTVVAGPVEATATGNV